MNLILVFINTWSSKQKCCSVNLDQVVILFIFVITLQVSQTINRARRTQIALPAQGLVEFKNALTELLDEFGTENGAGESRHTISQIHIYLYTWVKGLRYSLLHRVTQTQSPQIYIKLTQFEENESRKLPLKYY